MFSRITFLSITLIAPILAAAQEDLTPPKLLMAAPSVTITTEDFDRYVTHMVPEEKRKAALAREGAVKQALESMYIVRSLARSAEKAGVTVDVAQAEWQAEYYRDRTLMNMYLDARVEAAMAELDFTELAREEYLANPDKFRTAEGRRASHILVSTNERTEEEALALAEEIRSELVAGRDFAEAAKEFSDDDSAERNGGNLGFFGRGRMVPPFEEAAFSLDVAEISQPVKTRFGYHIIRVEEIKEEETPPFEAVEERLVSSLRASKEKSVRQDFIREVSESASTVGLVINQESIDALEAMHAADGGAQQDGQ